MEILSKLDHPHILNVYEYFEDEHHLYIVTELLTGGELFDKIIEKKRFHEEEAMKVMEQILSAVVFCHNHGIVHRDLKPENTLYATKKPDAIIRVIDFGTSVEAGLDRLREKIGTVSSLVTVSLITLPQKFYKGIMIRSVMCGLWE